jgi:hypothetical protein
MLPLDLPSLSSPCDDLATASDRNALARRLSDLVAHCFARGRRHGDADRTIRDKILAAVRSATEPPTSYLPADLSRRELRRHLRRVRRGGWVVAEFKDELRRAWISPDDEYGRETFSSIAARAIDRQLVGGRLAGPGVWPGERGSRR